MKKLLLLLAALLAAYMARRALGRQPQAITLLWALIGLTATAATGTSPKSRSTEARLAAVITAVGAATSAASAAQSTASAALPATGGTVSGTLTIGSDLHVNGATHLTGGLYGVSGKITVGDTVQGSSGTVNVSGGLTATGAVRAGSLYVNGVSWNQQAAPTADWATAPATYSQACMQATCDHFNTLLSRLTAAGILY